MKTAAGAAVRRAPFSANPAVGPRGQRTQQRILEAALDVLREEGWQRCSVGRITRRAGCSRVSFYQYFSSKEDVYLQLAAQVARQTQAAAEDLGVVTAGSEGWQALRLWVGRTADIDERYGPVFRSYESAAEGAQDIAALRATMDDNVASIRARLDGPDVPARSLDAVLTLLLSCLVRTFQLAAVLRGVVPGSYPTERIELALTDVMHRTLFGVAPEVNVHPAPGERPRRLRFDQVTLSLLATGPSAPHAFNGNESTVERLLSCGREVLVSRGYSGARVDDIVAAAGLSHGVFYRYFRNKDDFAHVVVLEAMRSFAATFADIPDPDGAAGTTALRRWLRRYNESHTEQAAIIRVWVDATSPDAALNADAAPAVDWGRREMANYLQPRQFGDVDAEGLVLVALLDAFGSQPRPAATVDAAAHIISRGLLGR